jgi:hypothetical protein
MASKKLRENLYAKKEIMSVLLLAYATAANHFVKH